MEERILGDYTLIKQIGHGSLGTVYLAEHRFIKRHYILKLLPAELTNERSFVQRFQEDIAVLATLDHPHIVKVYNVSFCDGIYFVVCDCIVDGIGETTNLAQYVATRPKPLPEDMIYNILLQTADALDYIHSKKSGDQFLVHRGLKLNNILIGQQNGELKVYLSDCGLSRIVGVGAVLSRTYKTVAEALAIIPYVSAANKTSDDKYASQSIDSVKLSTLHNSFLQNYSFLAPEQKRVQDPRKVTIKADAYAFGVLAYYLTTNNFPEGYFELPSDLNRDYHMNWDQLVIECLSSNPDKRPSLLKETMKTILQQPKSATKTLAIPVAPSISAAQEEIKLEAKPILTTTFAEKNPSQSSAPHIKLTPVLQSQRIERPQYDPNPETVFHIDTTVKQYHPKTEETKYVEPILTNMVVIKGGMFARGSDDGSRDEIPRHQIYLNSFALDIHPITNEQFARFLEVMGGEKDANNQDIIKLRESRIKRSAGKISIESGYAKHPVVGVTWYGAVAYAKWTGKRLPTEAEWEIAACGGIDLPTYPTGKNIEKNQANFFSADTTPVMSYAPNPIGLYDIAGNVYEWCQDWYSYNYYEISVQEPDNPKGPLQGVYRVLRGGCWKSLKEDLRCAHRHRNNPGTFNRTYGFRCAADVKPLTD
jgi:formylglycine-generating enzyme required for sulfatase activity